MTTDRRAFLRALGLDPDGETLAPATPQPPPEAAVVIPAPSNEADGACPCVGRTLESVAWPEADLTLDEYEAWFDTHQKHKACVGKGQSSPFNKAMHRMANDRMAVLRRQARAQDEQTVTGELRQAVKASGVTRHEAELAVTVEAVLAVLAQRGLGSDPADKEGT